MPLNPQYKILMIHGLIVVNRVRFDNGGVDGETDVGDLRNLNHGSVRGVNHDAVLRGSNGPQHGAHITHFVANANISDGRRG